MKQNINTSIQVVNIYSSLGFVNKNFDSCVWATGLLNVAMGETVFFQKSRLFGAVFVLGSHYVKILVYGKDSLVHANDRILRTYQSYSIEVGAPYLGTTITPLNQVLYRTGTGNNSTTYRWADLPVQVNNKRPVEHTSPGIIARWPVCEPLLTGWNIIDALTPIGRGQRQLIVGDRGTGKTQLALTIMLNQRNSNNWCQLHALNEIERLVCIYVAVGKRAPDVIKFQTELETYNSMWYSLIIKTTSADAMGLQYLSALTGTAHAEFYRDNGMHALVIYDDLLTHANIFRTMSLLMGRSPGREAYPGDVFYLHARLLERSAKLSKKNLFGSLSSLPVVETFNNDISSYIATNIISITDGQIYLDKKLFSRGIKPAFNMELSISRVGSKAQPWLLGQAIKGLTSLLRKYFSSYKILVKLGWDFLLAEHKEHYKAGRTAMALWIQSDTAPCQIEYTILFWMVVTEGLLTEARSPQYSLALFKTYLQHAHVQFIVWAVYYRKSQSNKTFYLFLKLWLKQLFSIYNFKALSSVWTQEWETMSLHT